MRIKPRPTPMFPGSHAPRRSTVSASEAWQAASGLESGEISDVSLRAAFKRIDLNGNGPTPTLTATLTLAPTLTPAPTAALIPSPTQTLTLTLALTLSLRLSLTPTTNSTLNSTRRATPRATPEQATE